MAEELNNVRVCLRVRPILKCEVERGETVAITVLPDRRTVRVMQRTASALEAQNYCLDLCFGETESQLDFFHKVGVEAFCDRAMEGQAATIFSFGQTGSGKTFTMTGPTDESNTLDDAVVVTNEEIGIQFRAAHYIASVANDWNVTGPRKVAYKASYIEIYNEQVNDLLNDTTNLPIRWSQLAQTFFIENLMIVTCDSLSDVLAVLQEGGRNRKRAAHKLNVDSSRSHVMFTIYFESRDSSTTVASPPRLGKINFVDLAGSEKLKDSGSTGSVLTETKSINRSLFTLGNVISCLVSAKERTFIPYRDSALTKLLMDSLGGACRTLFIACVTPSNRFVDESIRTIKYAMRTRNIVNSIPVVRMDPREQVMYELRSEIEALRQENDRLKGIVSSMDSATPLPHQNVECTLPPRDIVATTAPTSNPKKNRTLRRNSNNHQFVSRALPPMHLLDSSAVPLRHQLDSSALPPMHLLDSSALPLRHQLDSSAQPLRHQLDSSALPPMHLLDCNALPLRHQLDSSAQPPTPSEEIDSCAQRLNEQFYSHVQLRNEVSQLKEIVHSLQKQQSSSMLNTQRDPNSSPSTVSHLSMPPAPRTDNRQLLDFGFKPATKKINRIQLETPQ